MHETVYEDTVADVLRDVLVSVSEPLVGNPSGETLEGVVTVLADRGELSVRLLATDAVLKDARDDFLVASVMADLVAANRLELRTSDAASTPVVVTDEDVVALVPAGDSVAGLMTDDPAVVESANDYYGALWDEAADFSLRTPGILRVRETLDAEFGPEVAADFDAMLAALETARGNGEGLDEVEISLLVAANNEALFYDISSWAEDIGLASEATFSRYKTSLEEVGLLDTETVPIDVGRPRHRLVLGDPQLREADAAELATTAQERLGAATNTTRW